MLNVTSFKIGDITNQVSFNAPCTGIIQKSHPRSNFIRFHAKSNMAEWVFSDYPRLEKETWYSNKGDTPKIVVLQIMVFGDNELLVEYVYEKDLNNEKSIQK